MMGRFRTNEEKAYEKQFRDNDPFNAGCFYYPANTKNYLALLEKATKRKTPVTKEELYKLCGGKKKYEKCIEWVRDYYRNYNYEPPL